MAFLNLLASKVSHLWNIKHHSLELPPSRPFKQEPASYVCLVPVVIKVIQNFCDDSTLLTSLLMSQSSDQVSDQPDLLRSSWSCSCKVTGRSSLCTTRPWNSNMIRQLVFNGFSTSNLCITLTRLFLRL